MLARYIIERTIEGLTQEDLDAIGRKSNEILANMSGVVWVRSYVSEANGKLYCEYEAPSPDLILEASKLAGIPVDGISEISIEINPEMFR